MVLKPQGVWVIPRTTSGNRYHFVELGGTHCLCGRWRRDQLMMADGEAREPLEHVDARDCYRVYRKRYKRLNDY